jgi:hypothetical protein
MLHCHGFKMLDTCFECFGDVFQCFPPQFGDTAMPVVPSIFVVGLFGPAQIYDIDRLQIMSKVEVKRSFLKFFHANLAQWDSTSIREGSHKNQLGYEDCAHHRKRF